MANRADRRNASFFVECAGKPLSEPRTFIGRVCIALRYIAWVAMSSMLPAAIQTAIAIIIRFSVSEMKPRGTLLDPHAGALQFTLVDVNRLEDRNSPYRTDEHRDWTDNQFRAPATMSTPANPSA